jgi:flagellar biosynthesis/type III secretory pathway protein FliH
MSDPALQRSAGLAGLLSAMQPRALAPPTPPDLDAIREGGWGEGFAAGQASANAELAPLRLYLAEAAAALHAACVIDGDALRPLLVTIIRQIAETVVMRELHLDPAVLVRLVDAALALVGPTEPATLRAHPATLAMLRAHLPDLATAEDPGLAADAFVVAGTDFVIETGLSARLAEIIGEIA